MRLAGVFYEYEFDSMGFPVPLNDAVDSMVRLHLTLRTFFCGHFTMENKREIDELSRRLSQMKTREEKLDLLVEIAMRHPTAPPETIELGKADRSGTKKTKKANPEEKDLLAHTLARQYNLEVPLAEHLGRKMLEGILPSEDQWTGPINLVPCADVDPDLHERCSRVGTLACAGCRLVLYCSSVCQKSHWKRHKADCKYHMNSKEWTPAWMRELRDPVFSKAMSAPSPFDLQQGHGAVGLGQSLWGNVPAMDLLNLKGNEGLDYKEDLSLVFAASGDLRNVLLTINNIPSQYSGKISVVVNDRHPRAAARNLLILLVLMGIKDESLAADVALHLWYSAFIPAEYNARIVLVVQAVLSSIKNSSAGMCLDWGDEKAVRVIANFTEQTSMHFLSYVQHDKPVDPAKAASELLAVMFAPHRMDYHDRYHCKVRPAHRIAMREYRSFGLVLPFGAANPHFNTPNKTLFTADAKWIQDDMLYPTEGWNLTEAIATGKTHGATPQDIFGCLYFYLSEQMLKFKKQLRELKITFHLIDIDCRDLAQNISMNAQPGPSSRSQRYLGGLPIKFDRIDVSNTVDDAYVGYERTLKDWGPLLNDKNSSSTLLSYSMNWVWGEPNGKPDEDGEAIGRITRQLLREKRFDHLPKDQMMFAWSPAAMIVKTASAAMYENSRAFENFLRDRKVSEIASSARVKMKTTHTITPRRHAIPLEAPLGTLPVFSNDEEWYQQICLSRHSYFTRFQEFSVSHP